MLEDISRPTSGDFFQKPLNTSLWPGVSLASRRRARTDCSAARTDERKGALSAGRGEGLNLKRCCKFWTWTRRAAESSTQYQERERERERERGGSAGPYWYYKGLTNMIHIFLLLFLRRVATRFNSPLEEVLSDILDDNDRITYSKMTGVPFVI